MKKFLRAHILFPEYLGFAPYFWVLFILPVLSLTSAIEGVSKYFWSAIIIFYVKVYRDSFMTTKNFDLRIVIQLVIDMIFAVVFNYIFLSQVHNPV